MSEVQTPAAVPAQDPIQSSEHVPESEPGPANTEEGRSARGHDSETDSSDKKQEAPTFKPSDPGTHERGEVLQDRPPNTNNGIPEPTSTSAKLRESLQDARIEYPAGSHHFFVPNQDKNEIITEDVVRNEILTGYPNISGEQAQQYAKQVCDRGKNLFAVLAYMEKGAEICAFLDEGISDEDFPFERISSNTNRKCKFSLQSKGNKVEVIERWTSFERETFGKEQWLMFAPVFEDKKHRVLHKNIVLPFIRDEDEVEVHKGGYGEVSFAQIHSSHCWAPTGQHLHVAIKKLLNVTRKDFENERDILMKLGCKSSPHPHLVRLLASYEIDGEFFLIFPRAKCNLRSYWEMDPNPVFDWDTLLWSLRQMKGIAQALNTVHNFKVTYPLDHKGKNPTPQRGVKLSVTPGEAQYGRHGDIKPENIIFFEQHTDYTDDTRGILQITDFGLGRFHGHDSKTEQWPHHVFGSPTYEPPECKMLKPVSRVYDLWSLGCLYLEFATWLLKGNKDIESFSTFRVEESSVYASMTDDLFFTIIKDEKNGPADANVRKGVKEWVEKLHEHEKCSEFIHQLLDLVMKDLLRIDAADRIRTSFLCVRFQGFLDLAMSDRGYLCAGRPRKPAGLDAAAPRALSESSIDLGSDRQRLTTLSKSPKKVSFQTSEPREITIQGLKSFQPTTPSSSPPRKILKNRSQTWPQRG